MPQRICRKLLLSRQAAPSLVPNHGPRPALANPSLGPQGEVLVMETTDESQ